MRHARLQQNLAAGLDEPIRARGCEVFGSDFRVRISRRMYAYPDISVVCGKPVLADEHQDIFLNPVVIFEILSPSTEKYDRGIKFQHYARSNRSSITFWSRRMRCALSTTRAVKLTPGPCTITRRWKTN